LGFCTRINEIERLNIQGKKSMKEPHPSRNRRVPHPCGFQQGWGFGFRTPIIEIERLNFQGKKSRKESQPSKDRKDGAPKTNIVTGVVVRE